MGAREQRVLMIDLNEPPPPEVDMALQGGDAGETEAVVQSRAPRIDTTQAATAVKRSVPARMKLKRLATTEPNGGRVPSTTEEEESDEDWIPDDNDAHVQNARNPVNSGMSALATLPPKKRNKRRETLSREVNIRKFGTARISERKIIHVHQYLDTGRWGAWFRVPTRGKISERIFLGTHLTKYLAARCQDRVLLMHESQATIPVKLNFQRQDYLEDEELRRILSPEECRRLLMQESRCNYVAVEPTPCLQKFLQEEIAMGHIKEEDLKRESVITLRNFFEELLELRRKLHRSSAEFQHILQRLLWNPLESGENQPGYFRHAPLPNWGAKRSSSEPCEIMYQLTRIRD